MSRYRFADVRLPGSGNDHAPRAASRVAADGLPPEEDGASERQPRVNRSLPEDWALARTARVNVFLMGGEERTRSLIQTLRPYLKKPVVTVRAGGRLALPPGDQVGTLILYDVGELALDDQRHMVQWLEGNYGSAQVISTSRTSIVSKIAANGFLEALYYRLNTLYF